VRHKPSVETLVPAQSLNFKRTRANYFTPHTHTHCVRLELYLQNKGGIAEVTRYAVLLLPLFNSIKPAHHNSGVIHHLRSSGTRGRVRCRRRTRATDSERRTNRRRSGRTAIRKEEEENAKSSINIYYFHMISRTKMQIILNRNST